MKWFDVSMIPSLVTSACRLLASQNKVIVIGCLAAAMLSSCGGGGGGGGTGTVTSTLSFPWRSGNTASVINGSSIDFTVSGTCSGTANITLSTPIPATFETVTGYSVANTAYINLTNCNPPYFYSTSTDYYDSNYVPLGTISSSGEYGVFTTQPVIPVTVKVGDAGTIGTINLYTDSTKVFSTGYEAISYVIEPDTADTAIVNVIYKSYDLSGILTSIEQDRSRIMADGTLIPVSADIQAVNGSTTHFVFSAIPDYVPPIVLSTSPSSYITNIPVTTVITATFSEAMDPATVTGTEFTLMNGSTPVAGTVTYSGHTATFTPSSFLTPSTAYTARITTGVKDLAGNALSADYSWSFQTSVLVTPTVLSTSPAPYAYAVALDSAITATFSTTMNPATLTDTTFTLMGGTTPVSGTVTYSGSTATFTPSAPLAANTVYWATITTSVKDLVGTAMSANYSWTFQTFSDGSSTGPVNPPPDGLWQPAPGSTPATGNFVYLKSDVGDSIGMGQTYTYTQVNAILSFSESGGHLSINVNGNSTWYGNFQTMNTISQLQPGFYPGLQRYPFHNPVLGGLDWTGGGRGCNTQKGWFALDNVTYDANGVLTAIDLRFEQNCEGGTTALHGAIHWTSTDTTTPAGPVNPPPAGLWQPASGSTPATGNFVYLQSDVGDYIGQGQTYTYTPATAVLSVSATGGHLSINVNGNTWWYGNFQTMYTISQLQPGLYQGLKRYPFHNPAFGGLDWSGDGRGCNSLIGWFAIDSVTYDLNGTLTAIDLRFEQNCGGGTTSLHGVIHWAP